MTASRKSKGRGRQPGGRRTSVPLVPNAIPLTFSSGHKGLLKPLPYQTFLRLRERESEMFPEPEMPTQTIETDSGPVTTGVNRDSVEGLDYLITMNRVAQDRAAFRLDFILKHFLVIEGADTDEGIQGFVAQYAADLTALEELIGSPIPAAERWEYVLRHFILRSAQDYEMLQEQATALCAPVTQAEVAERVKQFRRFVAGQAAAGDQQPSGAQGQDGDPVQ